MTSQKTKPLTETEVADEQHRLFDGRTLKVPVSDLEYIGLGLYLWTAVFQARDLHDLREPFEQNWQTTAWDFGRFAKAHPALIRLDSNEALQMVKRIMGREFWTKYLGMDAADAEMAFDSVWNDLRAIPGYDPLTVAILKAKALPSSEDPNLPSGYETFLAVAHFLQRGVGDSSFMLPCHKLAPMLRCLPMTVSRYRQKALRDGYLKITSTASDLQVRARQPNFGT
jgi:hypothetical protein